MTPVDSTPEALALHYVGIGLFSVVNNIWTLLALFTTTLSFFWRLRGGLLLLLLLPAHRRSAGPSHDRESIPQSVESSSGSPVREAASAPAESRGQPPCREGGTRGKFVAYYREVEECGVAAAAEEEEETGDRIGGGEAGEGWEKAWRMRRKGRGWYDGLDLAVLNGSVVRLWAEDEEEMMVRTSSMTSSALQSMRCVLW